jgi:hypothetical protein
MGYKILGYLVWNGGKVYMRQRYGGGSRRLAAAGIVGLAVAALVVGGTRKASSS